MRPASPSVVAMRQEWRTHRDSTAILAAVRILAHQEPLHPVFIPIAVASPAGVPSGTPPTEPDFVGLRSRRDMQPHEQRKGSFLALTAGGGTGGAGFAMTRAT